MLATGTHLGPYEIRGSLGAGGMGEVYRARDTRLDRTVAIKILPADVAADAAARERLDREARAISQLDHPNICILHDVGAYEGRTYLVMQLVDGETLAACLSAGPLPVDQALAIAGQIAAALDAAHERGIVHRDLKPANVMVMPSGDIKVLDFGIAKVAASEADEFAHTHQPTLRQATVAGVVLGTVAYMSPEQSRGKSVDKRTDVWAFGCVLYEMLTGRQAFAGETMTDVLAAIVHVQPDWSALPANTPAGIRHLLARCLEKDARRRLRDIGDAAIELEEVEAEVPAFAPAATATPGVARHPPRRDVGIARLALGAVVVAALAALAALLWRGSAGAIAEPPAVHLNVVADPILHYGAPQPSLAFSPDGNQFVYTSGAGSTGTGLFLRSLVDGQTRRVAGSMGRNAVFSPDGQWVAATTGRGIMRFPLTTGVAATVSPAVDIAGIAWTSRDEIVYSRADGLYRVAATGGEPTRIVERRTLYPDALPDGRHVVVTLENPAARTSDDFRVATVNVDTGEVRTVIEGGTYGRYATSGHLLYLQQGSIMAVPFDATSLAATGSPVPVATGVFNNPALGSGNFAVSQSGTLIYAPGDGTEFKRTLIALAPTGVKRVLSEDRRYYANPRLSPDGTRVAVVVDGVRNSLWMLDLRRGVVSPLALDEADANAPIWAPDSRRLAVAATPSFGAPRNIYVLQADDRSPLQRITTSAFRQQPHAWTPDGRTLLFSEIRPDTGSDLWSVDLTGSPAPRPLMQTRFAESAASLSPDGRWMAYESDQSGVVAIYLTDFPALRTSVQVSANDGRLPEWSTDGRRLFYRSGLSVMVVEVSTRSGLEVSTPRRWGELPPSPNVQYGVMPNDELLVLDSQTLAGGTRELNVVLNFFSELRQKAPRPTR